MSTSDTRRVNANEGPLAGLSVLDFSEGIAGPYATWLLAQYGAHVIKVEGPTSDEPARLAPESHAAARADQPRSNPEISGAVFAGLNSGKHSVCIDLEQAQGRELAAQLAGRCDIVVESDQPGVMAERGLSYDLLSEGHESLVYCSVTPFGRSGPWAARPGTELIYQSLSGFLFAIGDPDREPLSLPITLAQHSAGMHAAGSIVAANLLSKRTGSGTLVDISIFEAIVDLQDTMISAYEYSGYVRRRQGNRRVNAYPTSVMPTLDGHVHVLANSGAEWAALADVIGHPELLDDPLLATQELRAQNPERIDGVIGPWLRSRSSEEITEAMQARRIPTASVRSPAQVLQSRHFSERKSFDTLRVDDADIVVPGRPVRFHGTPSTPCTTFPGPGEHTKSELMRVGIDEAAIARLTDQGIVK